MKEKSGRETRWCIEVQWGETNNSLTVFRSARVPIPCARTAYIYIFHRPTDRPTQNVNSTEQALTRGGENITKQNQCTSAESIVHQMYSLSHRPDVCIHASYIAVYRERSAVCAGTGTHNTPNNRTEKDRIHNTPNCYDYHKIPISTISPFLAAHKNTLSHAHGTRLHTHTHSHTYTHTHTSDARY